MTEAVDDYEPLAQEPTLAEPHPERFSVEAAENGDYPALCQADLAERIDAEQAQVSRYESGRAVPSLATVVRLAEAFGVCTGYLLVADAPRRPFRSAEDALGDQLATVAELSDDDRAMLPSFLDALVTRTRLKRLTADIS
jgi:transcriptional regulator with XRE-family HTH domain